MNKILIADTETTTSDASKEVIELAWVQIDNLTSLNILDTFEQRYKPLKPSGLGALVVHNILDSELEDCPPSIEAILPKDTTYMIAHNSRFDAAAISIPDTIKQICTQALAQWLLPDLESHRQSSLLYHFQGRTEETRNDLVNAHSALPDVMNLYKVFKYLLEELYKKEPDLKGNLSVEKLWVLCELARVPTRMSFGKHRGELIKDVPYGYKTWLLNQPDVDEYLQVALRK